MNKTKIFIIFIILATLSMMASSENINLLGATDFSGSYSEVENCWDVTKTNSSSRIVNEWIDENSSFENRIVIDRIDYNETICEKSGVKSGETEIDYVQVDKNCLKTGDILCCWLNKDGGTYLESRAPEFRTVIRSGESGKCVDLSDRLNIINERSDFGEVMIG